MIILSNTTDKIQVILSGAKTSADSPCYASWRDRTSTTFIAGRSAVVTNGVTAVDFISAPAGSTQRVVDFMTVLNRDTANINATVRLNANGVTYDLFSTTLAAGECLMFQEGVGFAVLANSGGVKSSVNQGNNSIGTALSAVVLGADVINNNATLNTMQDVSGLSFSVTAGKTYYFKFIIQYTAALTTTGSRWSINGPTFSIMTYISEYTLTSTTSTRNAMVQAYDSPAAANASSVVASNMAVIEGVITPASNGTVIARFASEISASAITAKAGSVLYYQQLN